jgi:hypothetical protein
MMTACGTHIYCDGCESVQPMAIETADDVAVGDKFTNARALRCGNCGVVIAVIFILKTRPDV